MTVEDVIYPVLAEGYFMGTKRFLLLVKVMVCVLFNRYEVSLGQS